MSSAAYSPAGRSTTEIPLPPGSIEPTPPDAERDIVLYVDADACPVKQDVYRVAERFVLRDTGIRHIEVRSYDELAARALGLGVRAAPFVPNTTGSFSLIATCSAIFMASAVFPMLGRAAITIISDRYVQLFPAYSGGSALQEGDHLGTDRTTIPAELDDVLEQLDGLLSALEPRPGERRGPLARLIESLDSATRGRSQALAGTLEGSASVLENLADGVVPADAQHLDGALAQAERLRLLVTDLLELSRLEAGVTRLQPTSVPVRALVADCIAEVAAAGRTGEFDLEIADDLVVQAGCHRFCQVWPIFPDL